MEGVLIMKKEALPLGELDTPVPKHESQPPKKHIQHEQGITRGLRAFFFCSVFEASQDKAEVGNQQLLALFGKESSDGGEASSPPNSFLLVLPHSLLLSSTCSNHGTPFPVHPVKTFLHSSH